MLDRQLQDVLFNGNYYKQRIEQLANEPPELEDLDRQIEALEKEAATAAAEGGRQQALAQEGPALAREQGRLIARIRELEEVVARQPVGYDPARHAEVRRASKSWSRWNSRLSATGPWLSGRRCW
jgi:hypothetical protein